MVVASATVAGACATLGQLGMLIQPPRFEQADGRRAEVNFLPPVPGRALGGAGVRLWTKVTNPNGFGFTLTRLTGTLFMDDTRATTVDLPLGLPLEARSDAVIPLDLEISFADLPALRDVVTRALRREPVGYALEGTIGVNAGRLGAPEFGPMTILRGTFR
jgi:Late embryogenesis abundant protein